MHLKTRIAALSCAVQCMVTEKKSISFGNYYIMSSEVEFIKHLTCFVEIRSCHLFIMLVKIVISHPASVEHALSAIFRNVFQSKVKTTVYKLIATSFRRIVQLDANENLILQRAGSELVNDD
jgi:hypothetical protein